MKAILSVWLIYYCAIFSVLSCIDCKSVYQRDCIQERKQKCELNYRKHVYVGTVADDDELTPERCCPEFDVRDCLKQVYIDCSAESWFVFEFPTPKCLIFDKENACDHTSNDNNKIANRGQFSQVNTNTGGYTTSSDKCTGSSWKFTSKFIFIFLLIRFIIT